MMKLIINLFKRISRYPLFILIIFMLLLPVGLSSNGAGNVIISQGDLDSALHSLQLLKPIGPSPEIYYRFDLTTKKLSKSNYREYMLNSRIASPGGQWVWESRHTFVNAKGEKKTLTLPDEVMDYVWSPQADKIAYIPGKIDVPPEGRERRFPENGIWIYNINTHTKIKISNIIAYYLAWPAFDGNLYINTDQMEPSLKGIYRYTFKTKQLELTPYKGMKFSPNGKYYFIRSYEGSQCELYERDPHKELKEIAQDMQKNVRTSGGISWLADGHSYLFPARGWPPPKFIVYDVEKAQVSKTIEGAYLGMNRAKTHAVFMTGIDQFKVVDLLAPSPASK